MGSVSVSLDGLEPQHNFLRNSSSAFSKTIKGLECLQKYAGQSAVIQITTVVYRDNLNTLEQMYAYISQLGVDSWRIINMEPIGRALDHPELLLEPEDYFTLFSFIREKRFNSQVKIDVTYGCSHYLTPLWEHELRDNYFLCGSGIYVASILCNGDIYSCLDIERRPELVQGNIETDDFIHVWEHGFSQFRKDRTEDCAMCRECSDRRFCRGDSAHTWNYDENRPYICMKQMMEDWI